MNKTNIEWVKNPDGSQGYTWNPITGCLNHINGLCKGGGFPCYAYKLAHGRLRKRYLNGVLPVEELPNQMAGFNEDGILDPFYPRFWEERLYEPKHTKGSKGIFVCDMGELFGDWIPTHWIEQIMLTIELSPQHRFYLLTKQPQNLIKFSPFPENAWVGVTATSYPFAIESLGYLKQVEAKVKYISFEPLLFWGLTTGQAEWAMEVISWLIIGAQTKPYKPPEIEWVQEIVEAADKAGVKVFLKDNLKPLISAACTIDDKWVWAKDLGYGGLLRQELPGG